MQLVTGVFIVQLAPQSRVIWILRCPVVFFFSIRGNLLGACLSEQTCTVDQSRSVKVLSHMSVAFEVVSASKRPKRWYYILQLFVICFANVTMCVNCYELICLIFLFHLCLSRVPIRSPSCHLLLASLPHQAVVWVSGAVHFRIVERVTQESL